MFEIVELDAAQTHPLRRLVLRAGTPSSEVAFDGDRLETTFHLGARQAGDIVAISTWLLRAPDWETESGGGAYQIRGMASHPDRRGDGAAAALLIDGIERSRRLGASSIWARARTTALGFYEHHGFHTVGDEYVDPTTGLPHRDIAHHLG